MLILGGFNDDNFEVTIGSTEIVELIRAKGVSGCHHVDIRIGTNDCLMRQVNNTMLKYLYCTQYA